MFGTLRVNQYCVLTVTKTLLYLDMQSIREKIIRRRKRYGMVVGGRGLSYELIFHKVLRE